MPNPLWKLLKINNVDPTKVFSKYGLTYTDFSNTKKRIPIDILYKLWDDAEDLIDSPSFALDAYKFWHPGIIGSLGYTWLSSTLRDAFNRVSRFTSIVNPVSHVLVAEKGNELVLNSTNLFRLSLVETPVLNKIAAQNIPLLKNMNKAVQMYAKSSGFKLDAGMAATINLAGKQRMLTQKMTKELLMVANNIDAAAAKENMNKTVVLFEKNLNGLVQGDASLVCPVQRMQLLFSSWIAYRNCGKNINLFLSLPMFLMLV